VNITIAVDNELKEQDQYTLKTTKWTPVDGDGSGHDACHTPPGTDN